MRARSCMDCPSGHPCVAAAKEQPARATAPMRVEEEGSSAAPLAIGQAGDGADARRGGGQQRCPTCDETATPVRSARRAGAGTYSVQPVPADVYRALTEPWNTHPDVLLAAVNAARVMPRAQSQQARYWQWTEERVNYPAPLVGKRLPQRGASDRVDRQSVQENTADTAGAGTLTASTGRDAQSSVEGWGVPRILHTQPAEELRRGHSQCGGVLVAPDVGAQRSGGTALLWRPASAGFSSRRRAAEAAGAVSRSRELSLACGIRPSSARPCHDSSSSAAAGCVDLLRRTRSTPLTVPPPNLVHASAAPEGGTGGSQLKAGRITKACGAKMNGGADWSKCSVMSRFVGQQRPRTDPSQRLDPPMLRRALIDQALSYVGTPYMRSASKHIAASNPFCRQLPAKLKAAAPVPGAHERPQLELDCSALIRQCVVDLQHHFGFLIGGWNQAYQFDTLPIKVETVQELEPGDLIFISGIYFDEKRKPKPHNMTHVEMYFPCGPHMCETIGSRHKKGCVQVHADFRFESQTYHSMQYHFCKIDTWLEGVCRSWCSEHRWTMG